MNNHKFKHFYLNKYLVSPWAQRKYYLCYNYQYRALWFRVAKVASRTIHQHFLDHTEPGQYIYSSQVGYLPEQFKDFFKFGFVRHPLDRFVSAWKNKVRDSNFYQFSPEEHRRMQDLGQFIEWVATLDLDSCDEHLCRQSALLDLNHIDFVGRFETFEADYRTVARHIGLPVEEVQWKNRTHDADEGLMPSQIERLEELYRKDFQIFYPD